MASGGKVRITISPQWDAWRRGFEELAAGRIPSEAREAWEQVTDVMFDRSQQYVHVDTGNLLASGHSATHAEGSSIVGEVVYDAEYAIYENNRGGEHAFLDRAYAATEAQFQGSMSTAWERMVSTWR